MSIEEGQKRYTPSTVVLPPLTILNTIFECDLGQKKVEPNKQLSSTLI